MEAGIDGGGLFKEFLDCFCKAVFTPSSTSQGGAFFSPTFQQLLTINPEMASIPRHTPFAPVVASGSSSSSSSLSLSTAAAPRRVTAIDVDNDAMDVAMNDELNDDDEEEDQDEVERVPHLRYSDKAAIATAATNLDYYHFIGKILGKACYDVSFHKSTIKAY